MPLYEYECEQCSHRFERIQKFSDPLVEICPECSGPVRKLLSSPAIQFKGTGWYITDYARKPSGGQADEKSKADETSAAKGSSDSSSDSKKSDESKSGTSKSESGSTEKKPPAATTS